MICKFLSVTNFFYIIYHCLIPKKYIFNKETRLIDKPFDVYNVYTYLSDNQITWFFYFSMMSNVLLFFGFYPNINLMLQVYNYKYLREYTIMNDHGYSSLLRYSNFVLALTAPSTYDYDNQIYNYGIVLLRFKLLHVYSEAFFYKVKSIEWTEGYSIKMILATFFSFQQKMLMPQILSECISYSTLFLEFASIFLVFNETRLYMVGLLFFLHSGMLFFMYRIFLFQLTTFIYLFSFVNYGDFYDGFDLQMSVTDTMSCHQQNNYNNNYHYHLLFYLFLFCEIIQLFPNKSCIKQFFVRFFSPFFKLFKLFDKGHYKMFNGCFRIISIDNELEIVNMNDEKKTFNICDLDTFLSFKLFITINKIESFKNLYPRLFKEKMLKRYLTDDVKSIKYIQKRIVCHFEKCKNNIYGGWLSNGLTDKWEFNYFLFNREKNETNETNEKKKIEKENKK